jgi:hypothetical protein
MFTTQRKRLARRPAGDEIYFAFEVLEVDLPYVAFDHSPISDGGNRQPLILTDRLATISVALQDADGRNPSFMEAHPEAPSSRKEFN